MCGVYIFRHTTGYFYIGSTGNFEKRRGEHLGLFRNGNHHVKIIQNVFKSDTEITWEFFPAESRDAAYTLEMEMIAHHTGNPLLTNQWGTDWKQTWPELARERSLAVRTGRPLSDEHRNKISQSMKGRQKSAEHIEAVISKKRKAVIVDGVEYLSCAHASKVLGVCANTVMNRARSTDPQFDTWQLINIGEEHAPRS